MRRFGSILEILGVIFAIMTATFGAAALVLLSVQFIRSTSHGVQWGTVAQWASAFASGLAFFAGVFVIRRDNRLRRRDEQAQRDADRRRQAELIGVYWDRDELQYVLINNSEGFVYQVGLVFEYRLNDHQLAGTSHMAFEGEMALMPRTQKVVKSDFKHTDGAFYTKNQIVGWKLTLVFTDQAGVHWRRDPNGALVEMDERPRAFLERKGGEQIELRRLAAKRDEALRDALAQKASEKVKPLEPGIVSSPSDRMADIDVFWTITRLDENKYTLLFVPLGVAGMIQIFSKHQGFTLIPDGQPIMNGESFAAELSPGDYTLSWCWADGSFAAGPASEFTVPFEGESMNLSA